MSVPRALIIAIVLVSTGPVSARPPETSPPEESVRLHTRIPLGIEGFYLRPARRILYVMSTADSPSFEGWRLLENGNQNTVLDRNGSPVRYYPQHLHFRVTATTMLELLGVNTSSLDVDDTNEFLRRLGFRLKVFHGLRMITLQPESIQILGMPTDVSSEERVYRATFNVSGTPIEDRMMLEILTPEGEGFCKFHLQF